MRRVNDRVRFTRIVLSLLESDIASLVEIYKGNVLTVAFPEFALPEGGKLDEVIELLVLALAKECGKDVRPVVHVRKRAKDGVDSLESHFVVVFVRPVKVDDLNRKPSTSIGSNSYEACS